MRTFSAHCLGSVLSMPWPIATAAFRLVRYLVKFLSVDRNLKHCHTCFNILRKPRGDAKLSLHLYCVLGYTMFIFKFYLIFYEDMSSGN